MSEHSFQGEAASAVQESGNTAVPETEITGTPGDEAQEPRLFTQEELDAAITKRLAKENRKRERERAQATETPRPTNTPLSLEQFKSIDEYNEAVVNQRAEQILAERENQKQQTAIESKYEEQEDKAKDKYSDFEEVAYKHPKDGGPAISAYMAEAIKSSDIGADIAYHLGKNTDESRRIYALSPLAQAREIGKIESALIANPPAKKVSSAPDPINPVGSRSNSNTKIDTQDPRSVSKMSTAEWIRAENARRAKEAR